MQLCMHPSTGKVALRRLVQYYSSITAETGKSMHILVQKYVPTQHSVYICRVNACMEGLHSQTLFIMQVDIYSCSMFA